jgi:hypothetical protein
MTRRGQLAMTTGLLACITLLGLPPASAEDAPRSYVASPDIYKVIADNGKTKVILATWRPGQRDNWHSHAANGVYRLTDCDNRAYTPDGKFEDRIAKAGSAIVQAPIASHSVENRGTAECRAIIVEQE